MKRTVFGAVLAVLLVSVVALASPPAYVPGAATIPYAPANTANWSPVPSAVNTALDMLAAGGGSVTLSGDTTGPTSADVTTGLHNVVNWQNATLDNGSTLAGGAASPPPANPQTYITITVNGSTLYIPAYHKGS